MAAPWRLSADVAASHMYQPAVFRDHRAAADRVVDRRSTGGNEACARVDDCVDQRLFPSFVRPPHKAHSSANSGRALPDAYGDGMPMLPTLSLTPVWVAVTDMSRNGGPVVIDVVIQGIC